MLDEMIEKVERFGPSIEAALEAAKTGGRPVVEMTLTFAVPPGVLAEFDAELLAAQARMLQ